MKLLLPLFLFSATAVGQNKQIIFAMFNDECIIWSDPSTASNNLGLVQPGDSCIILDYLKPLVGAEWVKVITTDTIGYAMISFLNFPTGALYELINEKDSKYRIAPAIEYAKANRSKWIEHQFMKRAELARQREEDEKREQERIEMENEELQKQLVDAEKKLAAIKAQLSKYTLIVRYYSIGPSSYSDLPDFRVTVLNCNPQKTIKYVWFNITAYNAVHDPEGSKTLKGVGPIKPFEDGLYNFDAVVLSRVVDYGKINSIKIQYMDGSTFTILGKQLDLNLKIATAALEKLKERQESRNDY